METSILQFSQIIGLVTKIQVERDGNVFSLVFVAPLFLSQHVSLQLRNLVVAGIEGSLWGLGRKDCPVLWRRVWHKEWEEDTAELGTFVWIPLMSALPDLPVLPGILVLDCG